MSWLLISIAVILLSFWFVIRLRKVKNNLDQFPEPPGNFIFGHALEVSSTTEIFHIFSKYINNYGTIIKVRVGPSVGPLISALATSDYRLIEAILSSNKSVAKTLNYRYLRPWLGNGLLLSVGAVWKKHRKIITPAFHFEILKQFVKIFESVGSILVEKLETFDGFSSVDLNSLISPCTLDIICETAMGIKINVQKGDNSDYVDSVKEMSRIVISRILSPLQLFDSTFWLTKDYYIQRRALKIIHGFTSDVINAKKEKSEGGESIKKMAFLDLMLNFSKKGKLLSDQEIREEVDTFMFEGHDTTAAGISFALFNLANHPEIQAKVLKEQKELFGDQKNPVITHQELQNMKYLELVIKESLRLYPSVPFIGRSTNEDLEIDGKLIPKRTEIIISIYHIHRNPEYFPEPEKFNPDRFETIDGSLPYAYIPFSAGPRNCIGQKFAMFEMKSIISKVVRHFELRLANPQHELVLSAEAVLKSINGVKVGLKKRLY